MELSHPSQISYLASVIQVNTAKYDRYISSQGLPSPSFDIKTPFKLDLPEEIIQIRDAVLEATSELQALLLGPLGHLQHQTLEHTNLISVHAIYRFNIATSFPIDEEASYEQISETCGLAEPEVRRILRYAMTKHFFRESRKGYVSHTAPSKVLAELPSMRDWVGMVCEEMWPSAARTVDAMVKWPGSQEPNHTGFAFANNTEDAIFTELGKYPARSKRFANAMSMISTDEGFEPRRVVEAISWNEIDAKTFVDVGGSYGSASIAVAEHSATIRCIVQDLPEVIAESNNIALSPQLAHRVTFMAHDFFTEQPVKGAEVYYFRWIFHDWSDKYCVRILQCLIPALKPGARVVISEFTLPPSGLISRYHEWLVRAFDLAMLELFNSKERDADDWSHLFQQADARFKIIEFKRPSSSKLSFIEAVWEGDQMFS